MILRIGTSYEKTFSLTQSQFEAIIEGGFTKLEISTPDGNVHVMSGEVALHQLGKARTMWSAKGHFVRPYYVVPIPDRA